MRDGAVQLGDVRRQLLAGLFDSAAAGQGGVVRGQHRVQGLHGGQGWRAQCAQAAVQRAVKVQRLGHGVWVGGQALPQAGAVLGQLVQCRQPRFELGALLQAVVFLLQQRAAQAIGHGGVGASDVAALLQWLAFVFKGQRCAQQFDIGVLAAP